MDEMPPLWDNVPLPTGSVPALIAEFSAWPPCNRSTRITPWTESHTPIRPLVSAPRLSRVLWYDRSVRAQLLIVFILIMSGFWLMFMQLFDLLPNFIVDWVDSSALVKSLHIPAMMTTQTARGTMITQEWMINLDSFLIVLLVVWLSHLVSRMRRVTSIFLGIVIASAGLLAAGFTMSGGACLAGIALFAIGEMLSSPKMNEYLGVIAPEGKKGLYMGYANMPTAIGWAYGSFMAGDLYGKMGEKAGLALRYLQEHGGVPAGVDRTNAMEAMQRTFGMDASTATTTLWNTYHPYQLWYPFVAVGLASAVGTWLYAMWVKKAEGDI